MCKWVDRCNKALPVCGQAPECSWAPEFREAGEGILADGELAESCGLVRARDVTLEGNRSLRLLAEHRRRQESGRYVLRDDVLNLRIALGTTESVEEFLSKLDNKGLQ